MKKRINIKKNILGKCRNDCGKEGVRFHGNGMWVCMECHNKWDKEFKEMMASLEVDETIGRFIY